VEAFDLRTDCLGPPVAGYLSGPREAAKEPSGDPDVSRRRVHDSDLGRSVYWAKHGLLALDIKRSRPA